MAIILCLMRRTTLALLNTDLDLNQLYQSKSFGKLILAGNWLMTLDPVLSPCIGRENL